MIELGDVVSWEDFRLRLEDGRSELTAPDLLDSSPRNDVLVVFRAILFAAIFELSDDDSAYMVADRRSVRDFVGLDGTDEPPTARSLRVHRGLWTGAGVMPRLAKEIRHRWWKAGYRVRGLWRLMGVSPVRVGWIVDAQQGRTGEVETSEAMATLARVVRWMAVRCSILVYTAQQPDGVERDSGRIIETIRPPVPLRLERDATHDQAVAVAGRALQEGRCVVAHRTDEGVFEADSACRSFLGEVEDMFERPIEIVVAGFARDGSMAPVVHPLLAGGHRVTVIGESVFASGNEPEELSMTGWAGRGRIVSLADLRHSGAVFRQASFGDIEIAEVYDQLDELTQVWSNVVPLAELDAAVPWELFRSRLEAARQAGGSPLRRRDPLAGNPLAGDDALIVFKSLLLRAIYDLQDEMLAFMLHDRLTFKRFAGLDFTDQPPSARWLRRHRIRWTKAGAIGELVADVDNRWARLGYRFQGLRDLMGASVAGSKDDGGARARPEVPGLEPELGSRPKKVAGKKKGAGRKRAKRRRRRKKKGKGRRG